MKEQPSRTFRQLSLSEMSNSISRNSSRSETSPVQSASPLSINALHELVQSEAQKNAVLKHETRPDFERELVENRIRLLLEVFETELKKLYEEYAKSQVYVQEVVGENKQQSQCEYELETETARIRAELAQVLNRADSETNCAVRNTLVLHAKELEAKNAGLRERALDLMEDVERNYLFEAEFSLLQFGNKYCIFTLPTFFPPTSTMLNPVRSGGSIVVPECSKFLLLRLRYKRQAEFVIYEAFDIQKCEPCNLMVFNVQQKPQFVQHVRGRAFVRETESEFILRRGDVELLEKEIGSHAIAEFYMQLEEFECFFLDDYIRIKAEQAEHQKGSQADLLIVIQQLAEALRVLHEEKMYFRYLCPENVIYKDGAWKLVTPVNLGVGDNILPFIVPEPYRATEGGRGAKFDVYALGILMYNMLMGDVDQLFKLPEGESASELIQKEIANTGALCYNVEPDIFELLYTMVADAEDTRPDAQRVIKIVEQQLKKDLKKMK